MNIDSRLVLRDALIIMVLRGLGGFLVGALLAGDELLERWQFLADMFVMAAGFCVSGVLVKVSRFKHLAVVAAAVWVVSAVNIFLADLTPSLWLQSVVPTLLAMGLGGAVSLAIARPVAEPPADPPAPQP